LAAKEEKEAQEKLIYAYAPNFCIQGEDIPIYLTWDKTQKTEIKITIPAGIDIKEIYNVEENGFEMDNSTLIIKKLEVNGYLGLILASHFYKEPMVSKRVRLVISIGTDEKTIEKEIELFRPEITVIKRPSKIEINVDKQNRVQIKEKIQIKNIGTGTALIDLKIKENSELSKVDPTGIGEFAKKFWEDFERKLNSLKDKYSTYSNLIDSFIDIAKNPPLFDEKGTSRIKQIFTELSTAFENDESFFDDFARALLSSYIKNISIITEIESFMAYLKSIQSGKVIVHDAVKILKVSPKSKTLKSELTMTDLAWNSYEPIDLSDIKIFSNVEFDLPVYQLFDFLESSKR